MNKQALKSGHVLVEVIAGRAGPSLSVGDYDCGNRVAGPKPWGGGSTLYSFQVDAKELRAALDEYAPPAAEGEGR